MPTSSGPRDTLADALGGYRDDRRIAGRAASWPHDTGGPLADDGESWALIFSLVDFHDIISFDNDVPGTPAQDTERLMTQPTSAAPRPDDAGR